METRRKKIPSRQGQRGLLTIRFVFFYWSERQDLNQRPSGYETDQFSVISVAAFSASNVYT